MFATPDHRHCKSGVGGEIPKGADVFAAVCRPVSLGCIPHDDQVGLPGKGLNRVDITGIAEKMHRRDSPIRSPRQENHQAILKSEKKHLTQYTWLAIF